jgi:hypothetical protein
VIDPLDHLWQASEYIDEAQDDYPVTNSDPESVEIVQNRVICLDQAAYDQDQPHPQLNNWVLDKAFQGEGESCRRTPPTDGLIGRRRG